MKRVRENDIGSLEVSEYLVWTADNVLIAKQLIPVNGNYSQTASLRDGANRTPLLRREASSVSVDKRIATSNTGFAPAKPLNPRHQSRIKVPIVQGKPQEVEHRLRICIANRKRVKTRQQRPQLIPSPKLPYLLAVTLPNEAA